MRLPQSALSSLKFGKFILILKKQIVHYLEIHRIIKPKSFIVAIAGDSGVGKDYLCETIRNLVGKKTICILNGDDYHKYERGHSAWEQLTHLNPKANKLKKWQKHIKILQIGFPIVKKEYDHRNGKFGFPRLITSRKIIVTQGLHAIEVVSSFDNSFRIFLEMDERLRVELKLSRDVETRKKNQSEVRAQIEKRKIDYDNFVRDQRNYSDLLISFNNIGKNYADISVESNDLLLIDRYARKVLAVTDYSMNRRNQKNGRYRLEIKAFELEKVSLFYLVEKSLGISINEENRNKLKNTNPTSILGAILILIVLNEKWSI